MAETTPPPSEPSPTDSSPSRSPARRMLQLTSAVAGVVPGWLRRSNRKTFPEAVDDTRTAACREAKALLPQAPTLRPASAISAQSGSPDVSPSRPNVQCILSSTSDTFGVTAKLRTSRGPGSLRLPGPYLEADTSFAPWHQSKTSMEEMEDGVDLLRVSALRASALKRLRASARSSRSLSSGPCAPIVRKASVGTPQEPTAASHRTSSDVARACLRSADRSFALSTGRVDAALYADARADLQVEKLLGEGSFAKVFLIIAKGSDGAHNNRYALKVLNEEYYGDPNAISKFEDEAMIQTLLKHPCLVSAVGRQIDKTGSSPSAALMEYVPGRDLFDELTRATDYKLPASDARNYAAHLVSALRYLHEECVAPQCIVHRDVKPENVIVDARTCVARLSDFGFAKSLRSPYGRCLSLVGTPEYMAPEVLAGRHLTPEARGATAYKYGHGKGVDWWGLGVLTYEMLVGRAPFSADGGSHIATWRRVEAGDLRFPSDFDFTAGPVARNFIIALLEQDPDHRLGNLRGGASDVQRHPWLGTIDFNVGFSSTAKLRER